MKHAFIEGEESHRQSKKFKQRLKYRLDKGYSYEEAYRLAEIKEIAAQPSLRLLPSSIGSNQFHSSALSDEIRPLLDENSSDETRPDNRRNSSASAKPLPDYNSYSPSEDEVRLEVERLKALGHMTEIPSETNFVSSAEAVSVFPAADSNRPKVPKIVSSELAPSRAPYWTMSTLACLWLVYSMTTSLPGHWFWNLLIAIAFEFTPMLMLGARVERKYQRTVSWGAVGIFLTGLGLYLAPSVQTLINESSAYVEASARYGAELKDYEAKSANSGALVASARAEADRSAQVYEAARETYGDKSWRTGAARKQKDSDVAEWRRLSSASETFKSPASPKISGGLIEAAQAIAIRIGLFAVVFLSMFVMQRLEGPETA